MSEFLKPKFITFDTYGTLINFGMAAMTKEIFADRVSAEKMGDFIHDFAAYRLDEVLGAWKPYEQVVTNAVRRVCEKWKFDYDHEEALSYYLAVPSWGPHADVPAPLARLAEKFPLVTITNASDDQIQSNIDKLGAPFHAVYTAQQAQAYKPRLQAFEYMLDNLGCGPEDVLHVSSSLRYDLMPANDIGIKHKVFVNRGHEPSTPHYNYHEISDLGGLPALVGL